MKLLTTGDAADLVAVHHSTIKRWCDVGDLACSSTAGGHRRIALEDLLALAAAEELSCPLLVFEDWAGEVWEALHAARQGDSSAQLVELTYRWLDEPYNTLPGHLMRLCLAQEMSMPALLDQVVRPVLHRIGEDWQRGRLEVGDEHRMIQIVLDGLYRLRATVLAPSSRPDGNHIAIVGCGQGNQHEMGAQMVRILLEALGWGVVYLGWRVPAEDFILQQQQFDASLICISLTPPHVFADARRLLRVLAKLYDPEHPFRLAVGGQVMQGHTIEEVAPPPFIDCRFFASTAVFTEWLDEFSPHPSTHLH